MVPFQVPFGVLLSGTHGAATSALFTICNFSCRHICAARAKFALAFPPLKQVWWCATLAMDASAVVKVLLQNLFPCPFFYKKHSHDVAAFIFILLSLNCVAFAGAKGVQ
jgi:hypothetical protein